jgi:3-dehydroquinate dehydratase-1
MSGTVIIKQKEIGRGRPKICIPITEQNLTDLRRTAQEIARVPHDLVEWRADFFEGLADSEACHEALELLREELPADPVLFTIRTRPEMGEADLSADQYGALNLRVIEGKWADLVDVELSCGKQHVQSLIEAAHAKGVYVITSRHDKEMTPAPEKIVETLCLMQDLGADIVKYAVMPHTERDVLNLLMATLTMKEKHASTPVITMSMGKLGALSRISGELFGSALTFGTAGKASAPGQLPAEQLMDFLRYLSLG